MRKLLSVILCMCLLGCAAAYAEEEAGEDTFLLKIWDQSGLKISYLRFDLYVGEEYRGLICSCPNEGEDFYRVPYTPETPDELENLRIEYSYGISDLSPEDAILQLMMGKPAEEHEVEGTELKPEAGKIYDLSLVMMDGDMNLVLNELAMQEESDRNGLKHRE